jgi:hypothetical protein
MPKLVYAQTVLHEETIRELKIKTGKVRTEEALAEAVKHYLGCYLEHSDYNRQLLSSSLLSPEKFQEIAAGVKQH